MAMGLNGDVVIQILRRTHEIQLHLLAPAARQRIGDRLGAGIGCLRLDTATHDQITRAESAIKRADEERVADYASLELTSAREKLTAARDAVTR